MIVKLIPNQLVSYTYTFTRLLLHTHRENDSVALINFIILKKNLKNYKQYSNSERDTLNIMLLQMLIIFLTKTFNDENR